PVAAHEFLVVLAAESSYRADRAARVARLLGGLCFTGAGKHFVQYRDSASPLGYDTSGLLVDPGDFVLYADSFTQAYARAAELSFAQLLFRLQLLRVPGRIRLGDAETLFITAPRGLGQALLRYLWRNGVTCEALQCDPDAATATAFGRRTGNWLLRVADL